MKVIMAARGRILRNALFGAALAWSSGPLGQALGSTFTYQGELVVAGQPANGLHDVQACLFDSQLSAVPVTCAPDLDDVPVSAGLFTIALDFGAATFVGQQRWLELRVRPGASTGMHAALAPRQLLRPVPEALRANVASAAPWSGLSGVPAGFADGVDANSGGTVTSISAGPGLDGGTITAAGTLSIANGGVTAAHIAPGAVGALQLAPGIVGRAQIDPAQVQARIVGTCPVGEYFRGVGADGAVACEPVPGVPSITSVGATFHGSGTALAIGANDLPVASFVDTSARRLRVVTCADSACRRPASIATIGDASIATTSIVIGPSGFPIIAYVNDGALRLARCTNAECTGAVMTAVAPSAATSVALALPADGLPVIAYDSATGNGSLLVAKCDTADCASGTSIAEPDAMISAAAGLDMTLATDGLPIVVYRTFPGSALRIVKCGTPGCGSPTARTVDPGPIGPDVAIEVGTDGLPIWAYEVTVNASQALRVAKCTNVSCAASGFATVDDPGDDVGSHVSMAIGIDGFAVISHYNATRASLRILKCGDPACFPMFLVTTIDDPPQSVGRDTAIAVGRDGLPVVAYRDDTNNSMKVAKCGTRSCL